MEMLREKVEQQQHELQQQQQELRRLEQQNRDQVVANNRYVLCLHVWWQQDVCNMHSMLCFDACCVELYMGQSTQSSSILFSACTGCHTPKWLYNHLIIMCLCCLDLYGCLTLQHGAASQAADGGCGL
jgi:hypothetical protein